MSSILFIKRPLGRRCLAILMAGMAPLCVWGQKAEAEEKVETAKSSNVSSNAIVSEKDSVKLIEDSTVSEAISRRPDLSFRNVTIDGETSRRSLGSISADSVTSVEVMKAVTPDQDADSLGGSISLKSRPAYDQKAIATQISLSGVYESVVDDYGQDLSVSIGGPLNEARTLGGRISLGYDRENQGTEMVMRDWFRKKIDGESKTVLKDMLIYENPESNTDWDISGSLDLKASDELRFFVRGSYRNLEISETLPHYEYRLKDAKHTAIDETGGYVENAIVERGLHGFLSVYEQIESTLGGEWNSESWEADLKVTYQQDDYTPIDYLNMDFVMEDVDLHYDLQDARFPEISVTDGKDPYDPSAYVFEDFIVRDRINDESDTILSSNVKWKNAFGSEKLSMRFGAKSRIRDTLLEYETSYYDAYNGEGSFSLADAYLYEPDYEIFGGEYRLDMLVDKPQAKAFIEDKWDSFEYNERRSRERSDSTSYEVEEQVDALYGMIDFTQGKWRALVGVRQEDTSIAFRSNEVLLGTDELDKDGDGDFEEIVYLETNPTYGSSDYSHAFPNAHVRYRLNDGVSFIASHTETIWRPLYADVVPYRRVDLEDREIMEGNPDLMPTLYTNLDLSMDVKVGGGGLLSFELFDRQIEDYIFSSQSIISGGVYDGFELSRDENSSSAMLQGIELTWSQPVSLPVIGEGFSFNANFIKQESELEYPSRPGEILPLPRRADNELKLALSYEREKLFAQVKINLEDDRIYRVSANPLEDRYVVPSERVDLSVSYNLKKKTRLYASWGNVTNQPYMETYEGDDSHRTGYRYRGWRLRTGVKIEL